MPVVRVTDEEGIKKIARIAAQMHSESVYDGKFVFDLYQVEAYGRYAITQPDLFGLFIYEDSEGEVLGFCAGFISPLWYFDAHKILNDFGLYVVEEKRGGMIAPRLIKAFEKWAKYAGVHEINMGISADIDNETAQKFYEGMGYSHKATIMSKEI